MRSKLILAVMLVALVASSAMAFDRPVHKRMTIEEFMSANRGVAPSSYSTRAYLQGFEENIMPPTGWVHDITDCAEKPWMVDEWGSNQASGAAVEGTHAAFHPWDGPSSTGGPSCSNQNDVIEFDQFVDVANNEYVLTFWMAGSVGASWSLSAAETVEINGTEVWSFDDNATLDMTWEKFSIDLTAYDQQTITIGFRYEGWDGDLHVLDAVMVDDGTGYEAPDPEPFANDTCEGALDMQSLFDEDADGWFSPTCDTPFLYYSNTYDGGCAPWGAPGTDQVYSIYLTAGETFTATVLDYFTQETSTVDYVIYVVTDCADLAGTCMAAADNAYEPPNAESLTFDAPADGVYYFILDSYSGCSDDTVIFVENPVATEDASFGSVKAMYR